jgi:signal transduction histidine kinase
MQDRTQVTEARRPARGVAKHSLTAWWRGALLWLALMVAGVLIGLGRGDHAPTGWELAAVAVVVAVAVAVARRLPAVPPVLALAAALLDRPELFDAVALPALCVFGYLAGWRLSRTAAGLGLAAALVGAAAVVAQLGSADPWAWFNPVLTMLLGVVLPWLLGVFRTRHDRLVAADRAREQGLVAREARRRERTRIAREMHDSLGHELSLLAVRAGALELAADLAEPHRRAVGELRAAAGAATGRLHEIIDLLRDDELDHTGAAGPGTDPVELLARARDAGLAVTVEGDPALAGGPLAEVLREALTNAAKHAPGAQVTVRTELDDPNVVVRVTNPVPPGTEAATGGRRGLADAAERLRALDGTLTATSRSGRFTLVAAVPTTSLAADVGGLPVSPAGSGPAPVGARARAVRAVLAPVGITAALVALLAGGVLGWYVVAAARATLPPERYEQLHVGARQPAVERLLPARQAPDRPASADPPSADCRYYRSAAAPFTDYDLYRICFAAGRLTAKDRLPPSERSA